MNASLRTCVVGSSYPLVIPVPIPGTSFAPTGGESFKGEETRRGSEFKLDNEWRVPA